MEKHPFTCSISQLAKALDITTRTIRFYEEKGLITPDRTPGNQRIYTRKNRARLKLILRGKRFGFSLDEIAEMIGMADTDLTEIDQIQKSLVFGDKKLEQIRQRRQELDLLEEEILATRQTLITRIEQLKEKE
ncbi:MAG: MerR family DNA-binding transcriptional regulator [Desulfobacterium sp.]|nr:MerR family DNA-binding transcriptional regulator [Desulfobacterium sp.]